MKNELEVKCFPGTGSITVRVRNVKQGHDHLELWDGKNYLGFFHVCKDTAFWWSKRCHQEIDLIGKQYPESHDKAAEREDRETQEKETHNDSSS